MAMHGAYIASGEHNGFFTLHMVNAWDGGYSDQYIKNLSRTWAAAFAAYEEFCRRTGRQQMTDAGDEFELCEWGAGGTADWSIARYHEWKLRLGEGTMPFGKHHGDRLDALPASYRFWLAQEAKHKVAHDSKFIARSWALVVGALVPFERADQEAEGDAIARRLGLSAAWKAADAASQHFGAVGERVRKVPATVEFTRSWEVSCGFGPGRDPLRYLVKFRTAEGNIATWFTSRPPGVEKGDAVLLTGTVKKHDRYEGTAQTILSRCACEKKETADA